MQRCGNCEYDDWHISDFGRKRIQSLYKSVREETMDYVDMLDEVN